MRRSAKSLKRIWRLLEPDAQISLACRDKLLQKKHSGASDEDLDILIIELNIKWADKRGKNRLMNYGEPFKAFVLATSNKERIIGQ